MGKNTYTVIRKDGTKAGLLKNAGKEDFIIKDDKVQITEVQSPADVSDEQQKTAIQELGNIFSGKSALATKNNGEDVKIKVDGAKVVYTWPKSIAITDEQKTVIIDITVDWLKAVVNKETTSDGDYTIAADGSMNFAGVTKPYNGSGTKTAPDDNTKKDDSNDKKDDSDTKKPDDKPAPKEEPYYWDIPADYDDIAKRIRA